MNKIILGLLHGAIALALPLALLFLLSCQPAHEQKAALGALVDPNVLQNLLNQYQNGDSSSLAVGQELHYQETDRIDDEDPDILMLDGVYTVVNRTDDSALNETIITVHNSVNSRNDTSSGFQDVESESSIEIPTNPNNNPTLKLRSIRAADAPAPVNITYYNLVTSTGTVTPPPTAAARSGCSGLSPCQLTVNYISFDEADWSDSTNYELYHRDFAFTSDLPYMGDSEGTLLNGCVGGYTDLNGQVVYVRNCLSLIDFQK